MCVYMPVWCMHAVYSDCIIYVHKAYVSVHVVCIFVYHRHVSVALYVHFCSFACMFTCMCMNGIHCIFMDCMCHVWICICVYMCVLSVCICVCVFNCINVCHKYMFMCVYK